jgi:protein required for attachment to host cells
MNIPNEALVLVGDGRKALFLRNHGTPASPNLVLEDEIEQDNPPTREQGTDRPGRKRGSDGVSRSAIEETDQHQRAEQRFAAPLADELGCPVRIDLQAAPAQKRARKSAKARA